MLWITENHYKLQIMMFQEIYYYGGRMKIGLFVLVFLLVLLPVYVLSSPHEEGGLIQKSRSDPSSLSKYYFPYPPHTSLTPLPPKPGTLYCDNGSPWGIGSNGTSGWKEAIKLTADTTCFLSSLLFWPANPDTESNINLYWRVWEDTSGFPGDSLDFGTDTLGIFDFDDWHWIQLNNKKFLPKGTDFYIGWADVNYPFYWNAYEDTLDANCGNYWFRDSKWVEDSFFVNEAFLIRGLYMLRDAGVTSIDVQPDTVMEGDTVAVSATVVNLGSVTDTFVVTVDISSVDSSVYSSDDTIYNLATGDTQQVTFDDWIVLLPCDTSNSDSSYIATVTTDLDNDEDFSNNTLSLVISCDTLPAVGIHEDFSYQMPSSFALHQSYPNPFQISTLIRYNLPVVRGQGSGVSEYEKINVRLSIFDITGRLVETLVDKPQDPGFYEVQWDGMDLSSGIYFYRLQVNNFTDTKRLILLR
jgi:hypothetical protein